MPKFSTSSANKLKTCDKSLQDLFNRIIEFRDCVVLEGHRNELDQNVAYIEGRSKKKWPDGNHNKIPSRAVDVSPFPIPENWGSIKQGSLQGVVRQAKIRSQFYHFAGFVQGVAEGMGISIRWGGDWDSDNEFTDQTFDDLVHFELVKEN